MKNKNKLISLFSLFLILSNAYAQKIEFDNLSKDGTRIISTEGIDQKIQDAKYSFSISVQSFSGSNKFLLSIGSLWKMNDETKVLFKLGNDEIVQLIPIVSNSGEIDYPKYTPIIGSSNSTGLISTEKTNYFVSVYNLDYGLLNQIEEFGISKMRIAFGNTFFEKVWKKDELGKFFKNSHKLIDAQLRRPVTNSKSIEENF